MLRLKKHEVDLATRMLVEVNKERVMKGEEPYTKSEFLHIAIEEGLRKVKCLESCSSPR